METSFALVCRNTGEKAGDVGGRQEWVVLHKKFGHD